VFGHIPTFSWGGGQPLSQLCFFPDRKWNSDCARRPTGKTDHVGREEGDGKSRLTVEEMVYVAGTAHKKGNLCLEYSLSDFGRG